MKFHDLIREQSGWETLSRDVTFTNPYLEVSLDRIVTPTRPEGIDWTIGHRKGAAVVAPITCDGCIVLVQQERIPIRASIWEFPAGQIDEASDHDEAVIRATALRELQEESGYELGPDGELVPMGMFFSSAGFMDEHSYLFAARNVVPSIVGRSPDSSESITGCREFTPDVFRGMIASGEIRDANTLSTFARMTALNIL